MQEFRFHLLSLLTIWSKNVLNSSGIIFRGTTLEKFARCSFYSRFAFCNFLYSAALHNYTISL